MTRASKMVYGVIICRSDAQHIIVMEDPNYDKCFKVWEDLHSRWTTAAKEQHPFVLTQPLVTAFAPSMIYEIKLVPMNTEENASQSHNPYYKAMNEQGFTRTFLGKDII